MRLETQSGLIDINPGAKSRCHSVRVDRACFMGTTTATCADRMKAPATLVPFASLRSYRVEARGARLGRPLDLYVDRSDWRVRFIRAEGAGMMGKRPVLVSPDCVETVDPDDASITLDLSKWRVSVGPETPSDLPVHRQYERELSKYRSWIPHWQEIGAPVPIGVRADPDADETEADVTTPLLSVCELLAYTIHLAPGQIATTAGYIIDVDDWILRYACNRLPGKAAGACRLVPLSAVEAVSWLDKSMRVGVSAARLQSSGEIEPGRPPTALEEIELHRFLGITPYWFDETARKGNGQH